LTAAAGVERLDHLKEDTGDGDIGIKENYFSFEVSHSHVSKCSNTCTTVTYLWHIMECWWFI